MPTTDRSASRPADATRWLDAEEQLAWRSYLRGGALVLDELDQTLQHAGLSLSEYEILAMLSEAEGGHLRMANLADTVVQSRSRLTHTAARMEKRGWVHRRPAPQDKRGVELVLTLAGRTVLDRLAPAHVESVRRVLIDPLGRAAFLRLGRDMQALREAVDAGRRDSEA